MTSFRTDPAFSRLGGRHDVILQADSALKPSQPCRLKTEALVAAGIIACMSASGSASANAAMLQVIVTGIRNGDGTINICVFNSEQGFPDCSNHPALISQKQSAVTGSLRFDFDVNPGLYAVSAFHDENNNGRLDTNFFGIPREGVGVSNNPLPRRGPPRFAEAVFRLPPKGGEIVVKLVYP